MEIFAERIHGDPQDPVLAQSGIRVRDILALRDSGMRASEILKAHPELSESDVDICKALAMISLEDRPEFTKNAAGITPRKGRGSHPPIKLLFDENLSWKYIPAMLDRVAAVSHIELEDMKSAADLDIWREFASNGSRAVIITRDYDFVQLAEVFAMEAMLRNRAYKGIDSDLKSFPFVVHIDSTKPKRDKSERKTRKGRKKADFLSKEGMVEACSKQAQNFAKEANKEPQRTVYMGLTRNGLKQGLRLPAIFKKYRVGRHESEQGKVTHLADADLAAEVDWAALNRVRAHVSHKSGIPLEPVGPEDYL